MGIQGAQMVATLAKGVDFQRGKTGLLNEFQDEDSKKNGLRHACQWLKIDTID